MKLQSLLVILLSLVVAKASSVTVDDLKKAGFSVDNEEDAKKVLASGRVTVTVEKNADVVPPDTMLSELTYDEEGAAAAAEEVGGGRRNLQVSICPNVPGFGFANDPFLTIFGLGLKFRIGCNENCCARAWSCDSTGCKLQCQFYTISVAVNPGPFCCRIDGRIVSPFPTGACFNPPLLCIA